MATFESDGLSICYEEHGEGFPVLLIAPGGMKSAIPVWYGMPWNPIEHLSPHYRVIAMDQRNAGRSTGPIRADHGWHTYRDDQLALLDHLGVDRFHVAGMCIGGPYSLGLIEVAPERVTANVMFQTIGRDGNRDAFYEMYDGWATELRGSRSDVEAADWDGLRENMYGGEKVFFNVDEDFVAGCDTPLLVLMGSDLYHPESSSRLVAELAPNATLIEEWKDGAARDAAMTATLDFLAANTPR